MQMATKAERQVYPMATDSGQAIPIDIIWPTYAAVSLLAASIPSPIVIAAGTRTAVFYSTVPVIIDFAGEALFPVAAVLEGLFVPAFTLITSAVPEAASAVAVPLESGQAGYLVVQGIEQWAAIGQVRSLSRR
jgi:hypothetical protein